MDRDEIIKQAKAEPDHFAHAKKIIAGWPEWKQDINCSPIPEPPAGEEGCTVICTLCLKRLQLSKEEMTRTCEIVLAHQRKCSAEMRSRLDAQQQEITELKEVCKDIYEEMKFDAEHDALDDIHQCMFNRIEQALTFGEKEQ